MLKVRFKDDRVEDGISEGDLKPKVVEVDPGFVGKLLREEFELEKKRYDRIVHC